MPIGFLYLILVITSFAIAIKYEFSFVEFLLLSITIIIMRIYFLSIKEVKDHINMLFVIFYIFCSVHVVSLFELHSTGFVKDIIYPYEYKALALWGNHLFFVLFITYYLISSLNKKRGKSRKGVFVRHPNNKNNVELIFKFVTYFTYFLSVISLIFGISSMMHSASIVLPFKLNGIIDELRSNTYPFIFALYLYDCMSKNRKISRKLCLYFFFYVILEVTLRASKSAFVWSFLPSFLVSILMNKVTKKGVIRYVLPIFIVGMMLYPIIEQIRIIGSFSTESFQEAIKDARLKDSDEKSSPYIRAFLTGLYYTKLVDIVEYDNWVFDFKRVPALYGMRGSVAYMTYEIDKFPDDVGQSSGITGLNDALLWGGYPLCYIVMSLILIIAFWCDNGRNNKEKPMYKVIWFFLLYTIIVGKTISLFIDPLFISVVGGVLVKMIIIKYYYNKIY